MEKSDELYAEISAIFNSIQTTSARHQKCAILLKKIAENNKINDFMNEMKCILQHILGNDYKTKNIYIEKCIDFLALFVACLKPEPVSETEELTEHPIMLELFHYLMQTQCNVMENVRYWSCVLISKILDHLKELNENLMDELEDAMLDRVNDPKVTIRLQAIICVHRLQDPTNSRDPIIAKFMSLIEVDISSKVRKLCLEKIAARHDSLPKIIGRTRDVDENVRLAAFNRLVNLAPRLSIEQKRMILKHGYMDTSEKIKTFVTAKLVPKWLELYNNDYLSLIAAIRFDADENDIQETSLLVQDILGTLFKSQPLNEIVDVVKVNNERLLPIEDLNWDSSIYWCLLIQHLRQLEYGEEILKKILPELVYFCEYIRTFYTKPHNDFLQYQFILKQLFLITYGFDVSDITSREALTNLISEILQKSKQTVDVAQVILKNLENTIPNTEKRCLFICEIVSNIMYNIDSDKCVQEELERDFQVSKLKVNLNLLTEELNEAVEKEDFSEANRLKCLILTKKTEIIDLKNEQKETNSVKKTDSETIIKYLTTVEAFLMSPKIKSLNGALQTLKETVIQEVLIHSDETVMAKALSCYGLCCIVDKLTAQNGIHIFSKPILAYQTGEECSVNILAVCIKIVVDLIRVYGSSLITEIDKEDLSESRRSSHLRIFVGNFLSDLIQGLVDLIDDEEYDIQELAGRGLCLLIVEERVHSAQLLARLILKWCNPVSKNTLLQQGIGLILQKIPKIASHNQYLEDAVLITVKTIVKAPKNSPLIDVDLDNIAKFLVAWLGTAIEGRQIQANLATKICYEMKNKPRKQINYIYSKMLPLFELATDDGNIREIWHLVQEIKDAIQDKLVLNNIRKYLDKLKGNNLNLSVIEEKSTVLNEVSG